MHAWGMRWTLALASVIAQSCDACCCNLRLKSFPQIATTQQQSVPEHGVVDQTSPDNSDDGNKVVDPAVAPSVAGSPTAECLLLGGADGSGSNRKLCSHQRAHLDSHLQEPTGKQTRQTTTTASWQRRAGGKQQQEEGSESSRKGIRNGKHQQQ